MDVAKARAQYLAAIAAGMAAACQPKTTPVAESKTSPSATTILVTGSPTDAAPAAPATEDAAPTVASATPSAIPSAIPSATASAPTPARHLRCESPAKLRHDCFAPRSQPPSAGGPAPAPAPYAGWDANGCFPAASLVGTCLGTRDAKGPFLEKGQCCYDVCGGLAVPCGRPLIVEGNPRVARTIARTDWIAGALLDLPTHEEAARAWQEDGAHEHASVASFAQLALELLSLGAPPELVARAHQAALDEIAHAKTCFAIAAALGEARVGPAPLPLAGLAFKDLASLAVEVAAQSCVGETVAGLALARASELCDPSLAPILARMAEEELAHAALGFRIVAWACALDPGVRAGVMEALAVGDYRAAGVADNAAWNRAGRLGPGDMIDVVASARAVIASVRDAIYIADGSSC